MLFHRPHHPRRGATQVLTPSAQRRQLPAFGASLRGSPFILSLAACLSLACGAGVAERDRSNQSEKRADNTEPESPNASGIDAGRQPEPDSEDEDATQEPSDDQTDQPGPAEPDIAVPDVGEPDGSTSDMPECAAGCPAGVVALSFQVATQQYELDCHPEVLVSECFGRWLLSLDTCTYAGSPTGADPCLNITVNQTRDSQVEQGEPPWTGAGEFHVDGASWPIAAVASTRKLQELEGQQQTRVELSGQLVSPDQTLEEFQLSFELCEGRVERCLK